MRLSFYVQTGFKRLQALLLRRWILAHVHETGKRKSFSACEQVSDDTFPASYLTKEFYHTPRKISYALFFMADALLWMRFQNRSLSQHGQPAFVLEGEGGGRFMAKNLWVWKKVVPFANGRKDLETGLSTTPKGDEVCIRLLSAFIYIWYSHRLT